MELGEMNCHIGIAFNKNCNMGHSLKFKLFSYTDKELLAWRTGLHDFKPISRVCVEHSVEFLETYSLFKHKKCFDPHKKHQKNVTANIREISLAQAKKIKSKLDIDVIPGMKLCPNCNAILLRQCEDTDDNEFRLSRGEASQHSSSAVDQETDSPSTSTTDSHNVGSQAISSDSEQEYQICKDKIEVIFESLNLPTVTMHRTKSSSKDEYLKRKLEEVTEEISKKMRTAFHLEKDIESVPKEIIEKAQNFDQMMENVKSAIEDCKYTSKLQLLTLVPNIHTQKIQTYLGISRATAEAARKLKETKGLFAIPDKKFGSTVLSAATKQEVINFYCDETSGNSKLLPGKKDCVSIGNKQYRQKQLMLLNLRELYASFKDSHPASRIGFSTFCLLRPKWCVLAGSPGTHSICVCTIHQNVELLIFATHSKQSSNDIISKLVCSIDNGDCMQRKCLQCPKKERIKSILNNLLFEKTRENLDGIEGDNEENDDDVEELIKFKEWISTDRAELRSHELTKSEFLDHLSGAFGKLIPHQYVKNEQFKYLRNLKEKLENDACIIMMDFSENYNYIVQDQAQGYYWTKDSCTIYPSIIYYKDQNELKHINICFISDDLKHDVKIVHLFQDRIIQNHVKKTLPHVKKIHYISDGCPGQFKNCQNFLHLCEHRKTYNLDETLTFFAIAHGKSPCDGIGATIKRGASNESLRRPYENQITNIDAVLEFCKQYITNIVCEIVRKDEVQSRRSLAVDKAFTLPGTRQFHEYVPLTDQIVQCKKVSNDRQYSLKFDLIKNKKCK